MSVCAGSQPKSLSLPQVMIPRSWDRNRREYGLLSRCAAIVRVYADSAGLWPPTETEHQTDAGSVFLRERGLKIDVVEIDHQR